MAAKCFIKFPGGKSRLTKQILSKIPLSREFHDVFVGGGSISIAYAQQNPNSKIIINDLDEYVYSMWDTIINGNENDLETLYKMINPLCSHLFS